MELEEKVKKKMRQTEEASDQPQPDEPDNRTDEFNPTSLENL